MRFGKFVGTFKVSVAGAVVAVALAGCTEPTPTAKLPAPKSESASSTSSAAESSATAPSTSTAPTTTYTPEEQAVIGQYKGYYNAGYQLSDPTDEEVRAAYSTYASQDLIENWVGVFQTLHDEGKTPAGFITFGTIEVAITGNIALTVECRDGTSELLVSTSDGQTISHGSPGTRIDGELQRSDSGEWLVWGATVDAGGC